MLTLYDTTDESFFPFRLISDNIQDAIPLDELKQIYTNDFVYWYFLFDERDLWIIIKYFDPKDHEDKVPWESY